MKKKAKQRRQAQAGAVRPVALRPTADREALLRRARAAVDRGEVDEACQLLSQVRPSTDASPADELGGRAYALQAYARWDKPARAMASLERAIEWAPDRADLRRLHGNLLRRTGAMKHAVAELAEARRLSPGDPQVAYEELLVRLAAGERDGGLRDRAVELQPQAARRTLALLSALKGELTPAQDAVASSQHPTDRLMGAVLLLARGEPAQAASSLEAVASREQLPRLVRAFASFYLGVACARLHQLAPAAEVLERARSLGVPDPYVRPHLAWVYQQLAIDSVLDSRLSTAAKWFDLLAGLGGPEAAAAQENTAYALGLWGQERAREGDYEGAVSAWSRALAITPGDTALRRNLAIALERAERTEEAIPHWHELVRQMPRQAGGAERRRPGAQAEVEQEDPMRRQIRSVAHRHLADLYLEQDQVEQAIDQLERAVKVVPEDLESRRLLAHLLMEEGRAKKAVPHLERVVAEAPESAADHLELGMALADTEISRAGIEHLEKAIALEPDNTAARATLGLALTKRVVFAPGASSSVEDAQQAVELLPPKYVGLAWIALGAAQLARGDGRGAKTSFKQAMKAAPSKALAAVRIGSAYWKAGDREAAIAAWTDAMKRAKRSPSAYAELAESWALVGDADRVRQCLQESLKWNYLLGADDAIRRIAASRSLQPLLRQVLRDMADSARSLMEQIFLARMLIHAGDRPAAGSILSRAALKAVETDAELLLSVILDIDNKYRLLDRKSSLAVADWLEDHGYGDERGGYTVPL